MEQRPPFFLLRSQLPEGELSQGFTWSLAKVRFSGRQHDPYIAFSTEKLGLEFLARRGAVDSGFVVIDSTQLGRSTYIEPGAAAVVVSTVADLALLLKDPAGFASDAQLVSLSGEKRS